jgi:hypothetical protein
MINQEVPKPRKFERWIIPAVIAVGLIIVAFFGFRAVRSFIRIQTTDLKPGTTDVAAIRGWMTVPHIARVFKVPEKYLFVQLGIPAEGNRNKGLGEINQTYFAGQPGIVMEKVKNAILQFNAERSTPTGVGK